MVNIKTLMVTVQNIYKPLSYQKLVGVSKVAEWVLKKGLSAFNIAWHVGAGSNELKYSVGIDTLLVF